MRITSSMSEKRRSWLNAWRLRRKNPLGPSTSPMGIAAHKAFNNRQLARSLANLQTLITLAPPRS